MSEPKPPLPRNHVTLTHVTTHPASRHPHHAAAVAVVRRDESVTDGSTADVEDDVSEVGVGKKRKKRKLKRKKKLHFRSDFVGNTSSSDEDDAVRSKKVVASIRNRNPADLGWMMWFWYYVVMASVSIFHGAEFCGEKLAGFFGVTSPKYQYAITEYRRMKNEKREEEESERRHRPHNNVKMADNHSQQQSYQQQQRQQQQQQQNILFQPSFQYKRDNNDNGDFG